MGGRQPLGSLAAPRTTAREQDRAQAQQKGPPLPPPPPHRPREGAGRRGGVPRGLLQIPGQEPRVPTDLVGTV